MSCLAAPMVADQTNPAQNAKVLGHHGVRDAQPPPQLADRDLRFVFRGEFPKKLETNRVTECPKQDRRWMLRYLRRHAGIIASTSPGKESIPEMSQLSGVDVALLPVAGWGAAAARGRA